MVRFRALCLCFAASAILLTGCPSPTLVQIAASASESAELIDAHLTSIRPQRYCRHEQTSEITERLSVQEFDAAGRVTRRVITSDPGYDAETTIEYRELEDGGTESESLTRVFLSSGDRITRQVIQVDALGRETYLRRDQGEGSEPLITETSYQGDTQTRVVTNGATVTTTTTTRDEFGNVTSLMTSAPGINSEVITSYSEDGLRPLQRVDAGNGLVTNWSYTSAGFESRMAIRRNGELVRERTWEFSDAGSPIAVLDREFIAGETRVRRDATLAYSGQNLVSEVGVRFIDTSEYSIQLAATRRYAYDDEGRLLSETIETASEQWEASWTWSDDGRLEALRTQRGDSFDERRLSYDGDGRLMQIERSTSDGYPLGETWSYDCL